MTTTAMCSVVGGRTESARESITLPDLLKRGTKKEDRESAAYEYCWATPMRHLIQAGDAHPPSTKTGDRRESQEESRPLQRHWLGTPILFRRRPEIEENRTYNRGP